MKAFEELKGNLEPGAVYRRSDLLQWSNAVDRHLNQLTDSKVLKKLSGGLYYYPKKTTFGEAPPKEQALVEAFLKDSRFLLLNPDVYNSLGVGATQLYSETIVYNHKRHGVMQLGKRMYRFVRKHHFPEKLTEAFLLVDLINNLKNLAEDSDEILENVATKVTGMNKKELVAATLEYGGVSARKLFAELLGDRGLQHGH